MMNYTIIEQHGIIKLISNSDETQVKETVESFASPISLNKMAGEVFKNDEFILFMWNKFKELNNEPLTTKFT